jgi:hypothetical protein
MPLQPPNGGCRLPQPAAPPRPDPMHRSSRPSPIHLYKVQGRNAYFRGTVLRVVATLCAGTFGTDGKLGGSQLALVPITVGLGETQSYQVSVPIKLPCRAAGTIATPLILRTCVSHFV